MEGWIKIHRKILDREWYNDLPTRSVFFHILILCSHEEHTHRGVKLLPGQCTLGRNKTSEILGISPDQYRTALKHLVDTNCIKTSSPENPQQTPNFIPNKTPKGKYTLITVVKWENYQMNGKKTPSKPPTSSPKNPHIIPTNKEVIPKGITEEKNNIYIPLVENFINKENGTIKYLLEKDDNFLNSQYAELDELQKDGYDIKTIATVLAFVKQDEFWSKQILSIKKLRDKNKSGIPYIVVMMDKIKERKPKALDLSSYDLPNGNERVQTID